jgi:hypothetical protein
MAHRMGMVASLVLYVFLCSTCYDRKNEGLLKILGGQIARSSLLLVDSPLFPHRIVALIGDNAHFSGSVKQTHAILWLVTDCFWRIFRRNCLRISSGIVFLDFCT